ALSDAAQCRSMAGEHAIDEHRGAVGVDREFNLCSDCRHLQARVLLQSDLNEPFVAWLQRDLLREILISRLADSNLVLSRQQQDCLRPLQFLQISEILPVNPDSGISLDIGCAFELQLAEHFVIRIEQASRHHRSNAQYEAQRDYVKTWNRHQLLTPLFFVTLCEFYAWNFPQL